MPAVGKAAGKNSKNDLKLLATLSPSDSETELVMRAVGKAADQSSKNDSKLPATPVRASGSKTVTATKIIKDSKTAFVSPKTRTRQSTRINPTNHKDIELKNFPVSVVGACHRHVTVMSPSYHPM